MLIELLEVSHRYRTGGDVITGINLRVEPGSLAALTGRSGCGKSTVLYIMGLMLTPQAGSVTWDGQVVNHRADSDRAQLRARSVGFVFQDALLDPSLTALDNVLEAAWIAGVPNKTAKQRAAQLMERCEVASWASRRPAQMSGGQAQRIALCRALVKRPSIILADEPTGNLDPATADAVWEVLKDEAEHGAAVVVATHDHTRAKTTSHMIDLSA